MARAEIHMLPCPFCGCAVIDAEGTSVEHEGKDGFQATCTSCSACGPSAPDAWLSAYRWNERKKRR